MYTPEQQEANRFLDTVFNLADDELSSMGDKIAAFDLNPPQRITYGFGHYIHLDLLRARIFSLQDRGNFAITRSDFGVRVNTDVYPSLEFGWIVLPSTFNHYLQTLARNFGQVNNDKYFGRIHFNFKNEFKVRAEVMQMDSHLRESEKTLTVESALSVVHKVLEALPAKPVTA